MDLVTILILAIALSADSFAVALSCGVAERRVDFKHATRIASSFALFQGLFPVIGWYVGEEIKCYIVAFDHWIAFGLLSMLGFKMIKDSLGGGDGDELSNIYSWRYIITLSIATAIDALVVGFTYSITSSDDMLLGAVIIGAVTFVFSHLGIYIGKRSGDIFGNRVEIIGGLVLIAIGLKILITHLWF